MGTLEHPLQLLCMNPALANYLIPPNTCIQLFRDYYRCHRCRRIGYYIFVETTELYNKAKYNNPWTPGPLDPWTPGPLDPWTPGPLDPWPPGPLDPWKEAKGYSLIIQLDKTGGRFRKLVDIHD